MIRSFLRFGVCAVAMFCSPALAHAADAAQISWHTNLNVPVYNSPQVFDGRVYLTSTQDDGPNVFALDGKTGKLVWSYATKGAIAIPPTVGGTQLFVASDVGDTHFMRALNAQTGALIWAYTRNQPPQCMCSYKSTLAGGLLFAQTDGHSLFAFQPRGEAPSRRLWSFAGDGALLTKPVTADGIVVFGSSDRNVYGLDAKTGKIIWQQTTGYGFTASPVIVDDVVVIGDQGGNMDGFAVKTGKLLWSTAAEGAIDDEAVVKDKTAFIVSEDHNLYALNVVNGQVLWQYTMQDFSEFAPLIAGGAVIVDNRAGQLLALDASNGKPIWHIDLDGTPFSAPVLWESRKAVVVKVGDHEVAAFGLQSGKELWRYKTKAVVTLPVVTQEAVDIATSEGSVLALQ